MQHPSNTTHHPSNTIQHPSNTIQRPETPDKDARPTLRRPMLIASRQPTLTRPASTQPDPTQHIPNHHMPTQPQGVDQRKPTRVYPVPVYTDTSHVDLNATHGPLQPVHTRKPAMSMNSGYGSACGRQHTSMHTMKSFAVSKFTDESEHCTEALDTNNEDQIVATHV